MAASVTFQGIGSAYPSFNEQTPAIASIKECLQGPRVDLQAAKQRIFNLLTQTERLDKELLSSLEVPPLCELLGEGNPGNKEFREAINGLRNSVEQLTNDEQAILKSFERFEIAQRDYVMFYFDLAMEFKITGLILLKRLALHHIVVLDEEDVPRVKIVDQHLVYRALSFLKENGNLPGGKLPRRVITALEKHKHSDHFAERLFSTARSFGFSPTEVDLDREMEGEKSDTPRSEKELVMTIHPAVVEVVARPKNALDDLLALRTTIYSDSQLQTVLGHFQDTIFQQDTYFHRDILRAVSCDCSHARDLSIEIIDTLGSLKTKFGSLVTNRTRRFALELQPQLEQLITEISIFVHRLPQ